MTPKFVNDTYVVAEIQGPPAARVEAIRRKFADTLLMQLPVEITIIGSSGVGVFDLAQDAQQAFDALDAIAAQTKPILAEFGPVHRFTDTDIFFLTLKDEKPFIDLHNRIKNSGLLFTPSPYPFKPHCTILRTVPATPQIARRILRVKIEGTFMVDSLSVYLSEEPPLTLLHRVNLTG